MGLVCLKIMNLFMPMLFLLVIAAVLSYESFVELEHHSTVYVSPGVAMYNLYILVVTGDNYNDLLPETAWTNPWYLAFFCKPHPPSLVTCSGLTP